MNTLLTEIDLSSQVNTVAKDLSGGQQRKLCIGIALIGNPKVTHWFTFKRRRTFLRRNKTSAKLYENLILLFESVFFIYLVISRMTIFSVNYGRNFCEYVIILQASSQLLFRTESIPVVNMLATVSLCRN